MDSSATCVTLSTHPSRFGTLPVAFSLIVEPRHTVLLMEVTAASRAVFVRGEHAGAHRDMVLCNFAAEHAAQFALLEPARAWL